MLEVGDLLRDEGGGLGVTDQVNCLVLILKNAEEVLGASDISIRKLLWATCNILIVINKTSS